MHRPVVVLLLSALAACGHSIGDSCHTNVDCSPAGDRFCDISAPSGYCSIDGCDIDTCPTEAICVRFLTPLLDKPCNSPQTIKNPDGSLADGLQPNPGLCSPDQRCVCNDIDQPSGHCNAWFCAPESTERRWCMKGCSADGDCRSGYRCAYTGEFGGNTVPTFDMDAQPNRYCAPAGPLATQ
jgi:hypothetical protein